MPDALALPHTLRQYRLEAVLGRGSGGVVYRALDTRLERTVVVKLLHAAGDEATARLLEEARLASAVDHPNVCTVYEAGEAAGRPFLVMQFVPGRTLDALLAGGPLADPLALALGRQVADGLAAAHRYGVLHRDLKPANVMVSDDGTATVLDFGLARRAAALPAPADDGPAEGASSRFGTTAYMAPEQFATRRSTAQSDVWSLGVILFQLATGRHPVWVPGMEPMRLAAAIQSGPVPAPTAVRPDLDPAFAAVIAKAMARALEDRYRTAQEVADALRTVARALDPDLGEAPVPPPPAEETEARPGLLGALADRLLPARAAAAPENAIAVLPFEDVGEAPEPRYVGFALADAVATRLASAPTLRVRPPRSVWAAREGALGPTEAGRRLAAAFVLTGRFARTDAGLQLRWSLVSVADDSVVAGDTLEAPAADLVDAQRRLSDDVFAAVAASGALPMAPAPAFRPVEAVDEAGLPDELAEDYLGARALLDGQASRSGLHSDLSRAVEAFERVAEAAPDFAPAHASLGVALARFVRYGYGGVGHLLAAQRHLDRALALDPSQIEAVLYRSYVRMWSGDAATAREDVQHLLRTAPDDAEVWVGAAVALQLDGLLDEALGALRTALRLAPGIGPRVYNLRARLHLYQRDGGRARRAIDRGLGVAPAHTLLRTTDAVWHLFHGQLGHAVHVIEGVLADDPHLRLAHPTMAIALVRLGERARAEALITDELLAHAAADSEMAYRVATVFAVSGEAEAALHWLRKAVHLGNRNAPWLAANPHWDAMRGADPAVVQVLAEVVASQGVRRDRWRRALPALVGAAASRVGG